jgi:transcriptional regulator with XRE-family HTH domain
MKVDGARLRAPRLRQGFSQEQLATKSGYGVRTIRRIEQGLHQPQPRTLRDLAEALVVASEELCTHVPWETPGAAHRASDWGRSQDEAEARAGLGDVQRGRIVPASRGGLYGVPRGASMFFVGRDGELGLLEEFLTRESYVGVHAVIEGMAGIGKTEVALQLVCKLDHEERFPGGIFWLDAESSDLRATWGSTIAEQCRIGGTSIDERCQEVLRRIEERREVVLVVLDNVESWSSSRRPTPIPLGPHVRLLITSRAKNLGGAQFQHFELGCLADPHDRDLVRKLAGRNPNPGLERLLSHLAGHTLALELAGAVLATYPSESAESYHLALLQKAEEIEAEVRDRVAYEATVSQALRMVWNRLDDSLREAWRLAACFAPEPASRELAAAVGLTPEAIRALEERHLVRFGGDGRWSMHRLTHAFGRSGPPDEVCRASQRFVKGCFARVDGITRYNWEQVYMPDRVHFDAALTLGAEVLSDDDEALMDLRFRSAAAVDSLGDFEGARPMWRQVTDACRARLDSGQPQQAERGRLYERFAGALLMLVEREEGTATLDVCVEAFREALRWMDRGEDPRKWESTQSMLAYALLRQGTDRRDPQLLAASVSAQRAAVEEFACEKDVLGWADAQRHLATALMALGQVTRVDAYVDEAEAVARAILESCSRKKFPTTWAFAVHRHAIILRVIGERAGSEHTKQLEEALRSFKILLEEWSYERSPRQWFTTQANVASTLLSLGRATRNVEQLKEGVRTMELVLQRASSRPRSDTWVDAQDLLGSLLEAQAAEGTLSPACMKLFVPTALAPKCAIASAFSSALRRPSFGLHGCCESSCKKGSRAPRRGSRCVGSRKYALAVDRVQRPTRGRRARESTVGAFRRIR